MVSLSCVWALSLLLSPSAASDYALPFALRPTLSYISNGEFWSAPLGPQVLADLGDSLTLLGEQEACGFGFGRFDVLHEEAFHRAGMAWQSLRVEGCGCQPGSSGTASPF